MSRGRKTKAEQLEALKVERVKKETDLEKVKSEIEDLNRKIENIENQILLEETKQAKNILNISDKNISLLEVTKALKEGNFEYLQSLHQAMLVEATPVAPSDGTEEVKGNEETV